MVVCVISTSSTTYGPMYVGPIQMFFTLQTCAASFMEGNNTTDTKFMLVRYMWPCIN